MAIDGTVPFSAFPSNSCATSKATNEYETVPERNGQNEEPNIYKWETDWGRFQFLPSF